MYFSQDQEKRSDARTSIPKPKKNKLPHSPKPTSAEFVHVFQKSEGKKRVGQFPKSRKKNLIIISTDKGKENDGQ